VSGSGEHEKCKVGFRHMPRFSQLANKLLAYKELWFLKVVNEL
jgi:hypothetical protein